ncbi:MAG: adenylate/guanylate cyclase domain-containing protein [Alphaproteobacteria bacterium]|nr:adenylate/guanylate cyclase domain-containing protein [Alphaproteobacteria bacterium]
MTRLLHLLLLLWLGLCGCGEAAQEADAVDGEVDLWRWQPVSEGPVVLNGQWAFWWDSLYGPTDLRAGLTPDGFVQVPGPWDEAEASPAKSSVGYATYRLRVQLPGYAPPLALEINGVHTAYRLWVNGQAYPGVGVVDPRPRFIEPRVEAKLHPMPTGVEALDVVLQVANNAHRVGGIRNAPLLGTLESLERDHRRLMFKDAFSLVTLLLVGVTFSGLFLFRRQDPQRMWFGPFCILLGLRSSVAGDGKLMLMAWPDAPWGALLVFEYVCSYLGLVTCLLMFAGMYPDDDLPWFRRLLSGVALVMSVVCLGLDPLQASETVIVFQGLALLAALEIWLVLVRALRSGRPGVSTSLAGSLLFVSGVLHDILLYQDIIHTRVQLATTAFLVFVLAQAWALAKAFAESYDKINQLSGDLINANQDLEETNQAVQRFVPFEFLRLLEKRSIRDIERGDHAALEMEVLFCDLRSFTTLVESKDPDGAFNFINTYLRFMEPAVHAHGGFINQYLGDCIMALFPSGADEAMASAVDMSAALEAFNAQQEKNGDVAVRVSVGLSSGKLMLGTIGGMDRLDSGVIGDPVNLAARLESMNRLYGTVMIVSERTLSRLAHPERFMTRELDHVIVKGKTEPIRIYEVLDLLPSAVKAKKLASKSNFEAGLEAFRAREFARAEDLFAECLEVYPEDGAARLYMDRCEQLARSDTPRGWSGVTIMTQK